MKRMFRRLRSLAIVLAITVVLLEVALRGLALLPGKAAGLASDPQLGIVGLPNVSVGAIKTNSAGFNDREQAAGAPAPKAVFVGDSFTFGVTSFDQNFPYLVEAKLGGQGVFPSSTWEFPPPDRRSIWQWPKSAPYQRVPTGSSSPSSSATTFSRLIRTIEP